MRSGSAPRRMFPRASRRRQARALVAGGATSGAAPIHHRRHDPRASRSSSSVNSAMSFARGILCAVARRGDQSRADIVVRGPPPAAWSGAAGEHDPGRPSDRWRPIAQIAGRPMPRFARRRGTSSRRCPAFDGREGAQRVVEVGRRPMSMISALATSMSAPPARRGPPRGAAGRSGSDC
jgi:hypothetical protein